MMRLPWFRWRAPTSVAEAAKILAGEGPQAMLIAGGTDLVPNMKRRHQKPQTLVSLRGSTKDQNDNPVFYWRNFVVDGTEAQSMVGIGSWGGVDKIRFEITENMLFARKAYPLSDGADDKGTTTANGTLVAAYPIVNHFDIKRDYNPQTREELNVINENSSDRPWYEREYFRVDWSVNMVDSPMWSDMFSGKLFGDLKVTPIAYYVNDKAHADAPHFDPKEGYFDVTNKFFAEPEQMQSPYSDLSGQIPACLLIGFYTGTAVDNCDPQEAVVRSSYWKVDSVPSAADFEPQRGREMEVVGVALVQRDNRIEVPMFGAEAIQGQRIVGFI